jgi:hypothetical protein
MDCTLHPQRLSKNGKKKETKVMLMALALHPFKVMKKGKKLSM